MMIDGFGMVAVLALIGGAIGGLAQVLAKITLWYERERELIAWRIKTAAAQGMTALEPRKTNPIFGFDDGVLLHLTFPGFCGLAVSGILIGIAGASGIIGILSLIKVLSPAQLVLPPTSPQAQADTLHQHITIFGLSVVAGFIARRLLPMLGESVLSKINQHDKRLTRNEGDIDEQIRVNKEQGDALVETQRKLTEAQEKTSQLSEELKATKTELSRNEAVIFAGRALDSKSKELRKDAISKITPFLSPHPANRQIAILAARLETEGAQLNVTPADFQRAIKILSEYLQKHGTKDDGDYADVLYNRACYLILLYAMEESPEAKEQLLRSALDDLRRSTEIKIDNKIIASEDLDFQAISDNQEFLGIISPNRWNA